MMGEADLRIEAASHISLHMVEFDSFSSDTAVSGLSTTISQDVPFDFIIKMKDVAYY